MSRIVWHDPGTHLYSSGVEKGVLYPKTGPGIPWNGLTSVIEDEVAPSESISYLDGQKYRNSQTVYEYKGTIEAYTFPKEFESYSGLSVGGKNEAFDFSYVTNVSSELGQVGYDIHLIYNALAHPNVEDYASINDQAETSIFSWDISTTPVPIEGHKPTSHLIIRVKDAYSWVVSEIEDILYGTEGVEANLPNPQALLSIFEEGSILRIIDHGDGTWSAVTREGYDDIIEMVEIDLFEITWSSALHLNPTTYLISSF